MVIRTPTDSVPPLENGDRLTRDEFERRYDAMPGLKKAELIDGIVYLPSPVRVKQHGDVPPLENGDRLTRDEFERRYNAMPGLKKAELIDGVVYMPSPVRIRSHGVPHSRLDAWLSYYCAYTPGTLTGSDSTVRLDHDNAPQPDGCLFVDPAKGGQAIIDDDDFLTGPPELVGEVSASTASYDLHAKLDVYQRHGVREYVVWRVYDAAIDWFVLRGANYEALPSPADGILKSEVFPGLWLDTAALLRGDMATVIQVVQRGVASPEHAAFVARLNP